ncbi:hypothetical protein GQE99_04190 [Maritimibacter sp. DP07]|uniref:Tetrahaem cytochrome domain-containing protein n=1 Tax=Maritimibacter harenae TaxID=2606218 RepID=A0A845LZE0_9RHOB|nr:cytochrome c3 family protein [Maritimibacter harenae]MZR12212.1 hypothetical protein [Maritimibacter harenae]
MNWLKFTAAARIATILGLVAGATWADDTADDANAGIPDAVVEECLACHGPLDSLIEKTEGWMTSSGILVNPHITFDRSNQASPHRSGNGIIPCTQCHEPHPLPLTDPVPEAGIQTCMSCHHTGTFRSCTDCH